MIDNKYFRTYKSFFGLSGAKLTNTLLAILVVLLNFFEIFTFYFMITGFNSLFAILSVPQVTYSLFFKTLRDFGVAISFYAIGLSLKQFTLNKLIASISSSLSSMLSSLWMSKSAFFGINFILNEDEKKAINVAKIIQDDCFDAAQSGITLAENLFRTGLQFLIAIVGLCTISTPVSFALYGFTIVIPFPMVIAAISYGAFFSYLSQSIAKKLRTATQENENKNRVIANQVAFIQQHAEAIAIQNAAGFEHENLASQASSATEAKQNITDLQGKISFLKILHEQITGVIALIIAAPSVISQSLSPSHILAVGNFFRNIVKFFTWQNDNLDELNKLSRAVNNIDNFKNKLSKWERLLENRQLTYSYDKAPDQSNLTPKAEVIIQDLTLKNPNDKVLLNNITVNFDSDRTLLKGGSGAGKSTLLKAIAGIWPFVNGKINIGCSKDQIYFIPQKNYLPNNNSLGEIILGKSMNENPECRQELVNQLRYLKLAQWIVESVNNNDNWQQKLSGGEIQKIGILKAIFAKPRLLIMDEATSALDKESKENVEKLLLEKLPETKMIYVDHNPSTSNLNTATLKLEEQCLKPISSANLAYT